MTKNKVSPRKPRKSAKGRKRGPKEERLVISGDPAAALARLLNPPKTPKN
jgi:hypothetical protein